VVKLNDQSLILRSEAFRRKLRHEVKDLMGGIRAILKGCRGWVKCPVLFCYMRKQLKAKSSPHQTLYQPASSS
jgi:hypothetical protein